MTSRFSWDWSYILIASGIVGIAAVLAELATPGTWTAIAHRAQAEVAATGAVGDPALAVSGAVVFTIGVVAAVLKAGHILWTLRGTNELTDWEET